MAGIVNNLLQLLVGVVDTKLLKPVLDKEFKAENVEDAYTHLWGCAEFILPAPLEAFVDYPHLRWKV